jgi:lysophospholipid acyltransferase (LPLAT)-like uncharacterized protein
VSSSLLRAIGPSLVRVLAWSWKTRFVNRDQIESHHGGGSGPVVAFWHQQIPAAIGSHFGYPACVLISQHRDGEMIAHISKRLGFHTMRGSSSQGGAQVVREMLEGNFGEDALCFTPDGPRGPCFSVAPGMVFIAAKSHRPVVLTGFAASKFWQAKSWDRMVIPKPFARIVITYSDHLGVPDEAAGEEGEAQERFRETVRVGMDQCEQQAQEELKRWMAK